MNINHRVLSFVTVALATTAFTSAVALDTTVRERQRFSVPEAHQAVAVDATAFYAIANRQIARYAKDTGQRLAEWTAADDSVIQHLNSGMIRGQRLYCANSNWPKTPLQNSIEIFDAVTLKHLDRQPFEETEGAINWIDRHRGSWWIVFAFYGDADVRRTRLVRYNDDWQQTGEWTFPEAVVQRFLPMSNSGGGVRAEREPVRHRA